MTQFSNATGKIIVITAPSGAGKTSITHFLLNHFAELAFSISAATRLARSYEQNGLDYYFMTIEEFQKKIHENKFVEWEMVYDGKYYGTLKSELERIWQQEKVPVLDVDVKGALHIREQYPQTSLSIFVEPPSLDELKRRLQSRGTETPDGLRDRISKASYELSFKHNFDQVIVNQNLDEACALASKVVSQFLGLAPGSDGRTHIFRP
jgi:guanylate kinase